MENELLSTAEAADLLGVSARRVLQMIEKGKLPASRVAGVAVIRRADVLAVERRPAGRPVTLPEEKRRKKTTT